MNAFLHSNIHLIRFSLQPIPNIKLKNFVTFAISITSDQSQGGYVDVSTIIIDLINL